MIIYRISIKHPKIYAKLGKRLINQFKETRSGFFILFLGTVSKSVEDAH